MPKLHVIIGSTRPGRLGLPIGSWAAEAAERHGGFEVELVDLADFELPVFDEPTHPRMGKYTHDHTIRWSEKIKEADAFVFVTPEYNYAPPPSLINAIDYLHNEWLYTPVAFVSYGGVAAGTRAVQVLKQLVTTLKMVPIPEAVSIPFVFQAMRDGQYHPAPESDQAASAMFDELLRWATALADLRANPPAPVMPPAPAAAK
ncbi:NADPH-dependent FMN reductase [Nocardia miyunensis]|uniref:NADPH-dependent FMN reductase n=1 Tax=Nocardia miyunensis TaxID=282684 RepID=UPI000836A3B5|nr:NAD(P)H-dependent oxidoreductase [Nocardia miyunensis]